MAPSQSVEDETAKPLLGEHASRLIGRLHNRSARVAVLGLGYAGLPMAVEMAACGYSVTGLDVDPQRVAAVNAGRSPVSDVADADVAALVGAGRLRASECFAALAEADAALIAVPTPLTPDKKQDFRFVEAAARAIAEHLHPGMLIVNQSTCTPGTTRKVVLAALAERGLRAGEDFFVAFAPERIDPGNKKWNLHNTPKLVGGITPLCTEVASLLFAPIVERVVAVSSPEVAEMAKLVENTFRFINISFANEMAMLCDRMGISVWEVIDAAATKPFAFMPHYPGPGVGGHCIPVVPFFLEAAAQEHGLVAGMIEVAGRVNEQMPRFVVEKLERLLAERGVPLQGARVLLLGVAYKPDVGDTRESPALAVLELLAARGAEVAYHDPHVPSLERPGGRLRSLREDELAAARFDAAVLLTPHSEADYAFLARRAGLVLDTRHWLREAVPL